MQEVSDDEIDLGELFAALLSGWKAIIISIAVFGIFSVYYALHVAEVKFESVAKIQLSAGNNNSQLSNLGGLASLAGISVPTGSTEQINLETRLGSRIFILGLDEKVRLFSDNYLNPYLNQNLGDEDSLSLGDLKSFIVNILKVGSTPSDEKDHLVELDFKIEHEIVKNFRSNLRVEELDGGALKVFFKHSSPVRAAEILNAALTEAINEIDLDKKESARVRLNYLEGELSRIQKELEVAVDAMQKYAVEYNLGSIQDLASSSFRTDSLRDELNLLRDTQTAIDYLNSSTNFDKTYLGEARVKFPFIGTLDFRSRLNLPADINAWNKPLNSEFEAAQIRISRQIEDLTALIADLENKARNTANEAKMFSELQRNITVKETLYKVVIKQFESQSLSSGLPGKSVEFFEAAVPPMQKTEPKRSLLVAIGLVLGLFFGSAFVLIKALLNGVVYSRTALLGKCKKFGTIIRLSGVKPSCGQNFSKSLDFVRSRAQKYRNLMSFVAPNQTVCTVVSTLNDGNARCMALVVMQAMLKYSKKVQLIDINGIFKLDHVAEKSINYLDQVNYEIVSEVLEVLQPKCDVSPYQLKSHIDNLRQDGTALVLLFRDLEMAQNELGILSNSLESLFVGVKVKKTTKTHLEIIENIIAKSKKLGAIVYC